MTIYLGWESIQDKVFGKISTDELIGEWEFNSSRTDREFGLEGMNNKVGVLTFNEKGEYQYNFDQETVITMSSFTGGIPISMKGLEEEGTFEISDEIILFKIITTNYIEKIREQFGDRVEKAEMFKSMMKTENWERRVIKLEENLLILEDLEGENRVSYRKNKNG